MSAGAFITTFYTATYGGGDANVHPIKVQPETIEATCDGNTNESTATETTSPISASVSRGRRSIGLLARVVYLQLTGTPPTDYAAGSRTKIPAMTPAFYNACIAPGAEINYLGTTWKKIGASPEVTR